MGQSVAVADHYKAPDWFTRHVFNPLVAVLTRLGVGVYGSRVLEVRGRKSGEWRRTPVNLLTVGGVEYLVAPRGHTQWVRNMRVSGGGRLILGRRIAGDPDHGAARCGEAADPARLPEAVGVGDQGSSSAASTRTPRTTSCCASRPITPCSGWSASDGARRPPSGRS